MSVPTAVLIMASSSQLTSDIRSVYNILLLGESGAGKTMFINSFVNYVQHQTLDDARKSKVSVVIPVKFKITDDNKVSHEIFENIQDGNECLENTAHSSTIKCKSYFVDFGAYRIRLIDTPGVGSTVPENEGEKEEFDKHNKGVEQDKQYVDEVLEFIRYFDHLHAIVIVVKSNETRCSPKFELCLKQLLSSFNKSAIGNLFFVLTFGESSRFNADIVMEPLKTLLKKVTAATSEEILSENKVYCVDNKGFRYLLAVQKGAYFDKLEEMTSEKAWKKSRDECKRFIDYISGQGGQPEPNPHRVRDTLSIKEARKAINIVEGLMEEILNVIETNEQTLKECLTSSNHEDKQIVEFEKLLNEKHDDVEINKVDIPKTACTASKCVNVVKVDAEEKIHYSKICCEGCKVTIMRRLFCQAIELTTGNCKVCGCDVRHHQRIYYTTKIVSKYRKDKDAILEEMNSATDNKQKVEIAKKHAELQLRQYENEKMVIESAQKSFINFLRTNPIIPSESTEGSVADVVLPDEVFSIRDQLINLEKFGPAIKNAYGIAKLGEANDWLAAKLDSTKEKIIDVKNSFTKWYHEQMDQQPVNAESKVTHSTAIEPIRLKEDRNQ